MYISSSTTLFLFIITCFLAPRNVHSTCENDQRTCENSELPSWCCSLDQTCGDTYAKCDDANIFLTPMFIAITIVASICCFIVCLTSCIHLHQRRQSQRLRDRTRPNPTIRNTRNARNQNTARRASQQVLNGPSIPDIQPIPPPRLYPFVYEEPPPPYEEATASAPSPSAPPVIIDNEEYNQERF